MSFPPLVSASGELPEDERDRTARQWRLTPLGLPGQARLFAARVVVLGAGGIGSPVLQYLAAAGVGTIGIIDDDTVDASNLQRQVLFGVSDIGRSKADVGRARIGELSPRTRVITHPVRLTAENASDLFAGYDLVIDGSDSFTTRYAVADACADLGLPLVWGSVLRFDGQVSVFWSRPPHGPGITLRDVFPAPPPAGSVPSCAEAGVLGALCGQVGSILVAQAVALICGIGEPLVGRMLTVDALTSRTREIPLMPAAADGGSAREAQTPAADVAEPGHRDDTAGPPHPEDRSEPPTRSAAPARTSTRPVAAPVPLVQPADLGALGGAVLVDVREPEETRAGTIPDAHTIPLADVLADPSSVPLGETTVVFCQQGPRARAALSALRAAHPDADLRVLAGGYAAWSARETGVPA